VEAMKEENIKEENLCGINKEFETCPDGILYVEKRSCLPRYGGLRDLIMKESYKSKSSIHLGSDKMYHDLKKLYWWPNMKEEIATYTDSQSERTIQTLEDMLRAYVIDFSNG
ncbi:putative reverse transcriptase domain-containing protein, partial [Tanacetum coccineum]